VKRLKQYFSSIQRIRSRMKKILFINQRNLNYIYPNNPRRHYPLADNKLLTKELLQSIDIPIAETYITYQYFYNLLSLRTDLEPYSSFVIKPAGGKGGGGILVIASRGDDSSGVYWIGVNGKKYSLEYIRKHISDIIFGVYSFGLNDTAIIEARIEQHSIIDPLSPYGLADVRIIVKKHSPIIAMIRVTTKSSNGTANLHQGAVGVGINLQTGVTNNASLNGEFINTHPDNQSPLIGLTIPYWSDLLNISTKIAAAMPLKYLGMDLAISGAGPVVLEVNVRPGIEVQNVNGFGMRTFLESDDSESSFK